MLDQSSLNMTHKRTIFFHAAVIFVILVTDLTLAQTTEDHPTPTDFYDGCPNDSYINHSGDCRCLPCKTVECPLDEVKTVLREALEIPGECCDVSECTPRTNKCQNDGHMYEPDTNITISGKSCQCKNGVFLCDHVDELREELKTERDNNCLDPYGFHAHGSSWMQDTCTNCTCLNGEVKCEAHFCDDPTSVLCAPLDSCYLHCPYGLFRDSYGCERCECQLDPRLLSLFKEKRFTDDEVFVVTKVINSQRIVFDGSPKSESNNLVVVLVLLIAGLILVTAGLLMLLMHRHTHKMDIYTTNDLKKYINVPNFDTNSNATYKFNSDVAKATY